MGHAIRWPGVSSLAQGANEWPVPSDALELGLSNMFVIYPDAVEDGPVGSTGDLWRRQRKAVVGFKETSR